MAFKVKDKLEGGFANNVGYYASKQGRYVVKTYAGENIAGTSAAERFRREVVALARQNLVLAPVPHLLGYNVSTCQILMEFIPNTPSLDTYIRGLGGAERGKILRLAGQTMRGVHRLSDNDGLDYMLKYVHKTQEALRETLPLLVLEGIDICGVQNALSLLLDEEPLSSYPISYIHRDPWLNNFLYDGFEKVLLIDWEYAGIGSPYEDFAIVDLWIAREHGDIEDFWVGYGSRPERATVLGFVLAKCLQFLSITSIPQLMEEKRNGGGFYSNKLAVIKDVLAELKK